MELSFPLPGSEHRVENTCFGACRKPAARERARDHGGRARGSCFPRGPSSCASPDLLRGASLALSPGLSPPSSPLLPLISHLPHLFSSIFRLSLISHSLQQLVQCDLRVCEASRSGNLPPQHLGAATRLRVQSWCTVSLENHEWIQGSVTLTPSCTCVSQGKVHHMDRKIGGGCVRIPESVKLTKSGAAPNQASFPFYKTNINGFQTILCRAPKVMGICSGEKVVLGVKGLAPQLQFHLWGSASIRTAPTGPPAQVLAAPQTR